MKGICHARLVRADAAHLNGVLGIRRTAFSKRWSDEGDDMIPARKDEVANQSFISVDDEVSAKFFGFFVPSHEFCGRQITKIAPYGLAVSDHPGRCLSSIIRTRTMIGTRPQSRVMLCSTLVSPLIFQHILTCIRPLYEVKRSRAYECMVIWWNRCACACIPRTGRLFVPCSTYRGLEPSGVQWIPHRSILVIIHRYELGYVGEYCHSRLMRLPHPV